MDDANEPVLRVVRGSPTAQELAALVGVLALRRAPSPSLAAPTTSRWRASALPSAGGRPGGGPGAWRHSVPALGLWRR